MNKKLLKKLHFIAETEGTSMEPMIHPDDGLFVRPISFKQIKTNDIIVFEQDNKLITHRVIYKKNKYLITKGDNSPENDGKIYENNIVGKVYQVKRSGKIFSLEQLYLIQSTIYFREIVKVISLLEKRKINYVILKGLPLHLYYESSIPKRIYFDCDIMINKVDFVETEKEFNKLGYKIFDTAFNKEKKILIKNRVEISFLKIINDFPVVFDIHFKPVFLMTRLTNLGALYEDKLLNEYDNDLLTNKALIVINTIRFPVLNKINLVIYLALHIFHHNYKGVFRLNFLAKVIKKENLTEGEWIDIINKINQYKLGNFVYPIFKLLIKYFEIKIPLFFFKSLKIRNLKLLSAFIKTDIFADYTRFGGGIKRFITIFLLSPRPFLIRVLIFLNPQVVYFIFWSLKKKLSSYSRAFLKKNSRLF